jgi:hypothetical protein
MKKLMTCLTMGALATVLGVASTSANAQSERERSVFTLTEPLEVGPGVLQPGTYLIKVVLIDSNRDMLQVTDTEETKVFINALSRPHPILSDEVIPNSRYTFYPPLPGQPKSLKTWFARDSGNGHDIIYPQRRAAEIAVAAKEPVIAIPDEVKETEYKVAPLYIVTPDAKVKPYQAPPAAVVAEARPLKPLPATASHVPLFAALGLLSLAGAFSLRALVTRIL